MDILNLHVYISAEAALAGPFIYSTMRGAVKIWSGWKERWWDPDGGEGGKVSSSRQASNSCSSTFWATSCYKIENTCYLHLKCDVQPSVLSIHVHCIHM